jgi:uncharacterized protein (DUF488 family)
MTKTLYMIGHSNHDWPTFKQLLLDHAIGTLIDVRSSPRSRFAQFDGGRLRVNLAPIVYEHWPSLGGRDTAAREPQTELKRLLQSADQDSSPRMCLMCSEGDYRECHRHYLLAPLAIELGWNVIQVNRYGSLTPLNASPS